MLLELPLGEDGTSCSEICASVLLSGGISSTEVRQSGEAKSITSKEACGGRTGIASDETCADVSAAAGCSMFSDLVGESPCDGELWSSAAIGFQTTMSASSAPTCLQGDKRAEMPCCTNGRSSARQKFTSRGLASSIDKAVFN